MPRVAPCTELSAYAVNFTAQRSEGDHGDGAMAGDGGH